MADQVSRGGKKAGGLDPQHPTRDTHAKPAGERPAEGQPGGPKPNTGHTRPVHDKKNEK